MSAWFRTLWAETRRFDHVIFVLTLSLAAWNALAFFGLVPNLRDPDGVTALVALILPFLAVQGLVSARSALRWDALRREAEALDRMMEMLDDLKDLR